VQFPFQGEAVRSTTYDASLEQKGYKIEGLPERPAEGTIAFQPKHGEPIDYEKIVDGMDLPRSIRSDYKESARKMNAGYTSEHWDRFEYQEQKRIHDILESAEEQSGNYYALGSRDAKYGLKPFPGAKPLPPVFEGASATPELWDKIGRRILEDSNINWFKGFGGNEKLAEIIDKLKSGEINPANYEKLIGDNREFARSAFELLEKYKENPEGDFSTNDLFFTRDAKEDLRKQLEAKWGASLGSPQAQEFFKGGTKFQSKKKADEGLKFKKSKTGFSKAWILPSGEIKQLGGEFHHEFLNRSPELLEKYGIPSTDSSESNRQDALAKGFARVNWEDRGGRLTVEARLKDWRKIKPIMKQKADQPTSLGEQMEERFEAFKDKASEAA